MCSGKFGFSYFSLKKVGDVMLKFGILLIYQVGLELPLQKLEQEFDPRIEHPYGFLAIMVAFAMRMSTISGKDMQEVMLRNTPLYEIISGEWTFGSEMSSRWLTLMEKLDRVSTLEGSADEIFRFYLSECPTALHVNYPLEIDGERATFGCFSFTGPGRTDTIRIHFTNLWRYPDGPLADSLMADRQAELKMLLSFVRENFPWVKYVRGGSWLYGNSRYTQLFPQSYTTNMKIQTPDAFLTANPGTEAERSLRNMSVWGQFLKGSGALNLERVKQFLDNINKANSYEELVNSFPVPVFLPVGEISDFYQMYGIEA